MIRANELDLGGLAMPAIFSQLDSFHMSTKNAIKEIDNIAQAPFEKIEEKYYCYCCHGVIVEVI